MTRTVVQQGGEGGEWPGPGAGALPGGRQWWGRVMKMEGAAEWVLHRAPDGEG